METAVLTASQEAPPPTRQAQVHPFQPNPKVTWPQAPQADPVSGQLMLVED